MLLMLSVKGALTGDIIHTSGCTDLILQTFKGRLFHISILAFAIGVFEASVVVGRTRNLEKIKSTSFLVNCFNITLPST